MILSLAGMMKEARDINVQMIIEENMVYIMINLIEFLTILNISSYFKIL